MVTKASILLFMLLNVFGLFGQKYNVDTVHIKTDGPVFSAIYYDSGLVFCNNRKDRITRTVLDVHGDEPVDLYFTSTTGGEVTRFDAKLRSDMHDGPVAFADNESYAILSRNYFTNPFLKKTAKVKNLLGLYESKMVDGEWTELIPFQFNDTTYSCTHPALNEAGDLLLFSSNMPGGHGGFDLWKCNKVNGVWSTPVNMGKGINSKKNEVFPFIDGEYIYFSSNRNVFGGLDVYQGCLNEKNCAVEIVPEPINSNKDDFGLISKDHLESGYISSNRSGLDQIWKFDYEYPLFENCDPLVQDNFCYTLLEENAHELGGVESLIYRWKINDAIRYGVEIDYCFPEPGDYEITIDIIDTIVNVVYAEQDYFLMNVEYEVQPYITCKDTVQPGEVFHLNPEGTNLPDVSIDGYYWFFSDGKRLRTKEIEYAFNEVGTYEVILGVIGIDEYGDTIKDCTTKKIVCTTEATELALIKTATINELPDNMEIIKQHVAPKQSDSTEVFHSIAVITSAEQLNLEDTMFVDFTDMYAVTEVYNDTTKEYTYHIGQWKEMTSAYPVWKEIIQDCCPNAQIVSDQKDTSNYVPKNKTFVIDDLLFATKKWSLSEKAKKSINDLVTALQDNPQLSVIIHAHTDDVGKETDNMILSEKRAKSVLNYIQSKGIHHTRITSKGFGESMPVADNKTIEGRKINRRVEFKLVSK